MYLWRDTKVRQGERKKSGKVRNGERLKRKKLGRELAMGEELNGELTRGREHPEDTYANTRILLAGGQTTTSTYLFLSMGGSFFFSL